ncbi:predicted protein [Nematostella vectensis]|uniref:Uncharacterized protein n=1 Tax=Nematostella vectensis TaxID=45351 RepID=A7S3M3_NEMVE|nr:predicted protein [Nematostella vectensis]|eukprot:XP_001633723.1 predicted protein [Nematostella vectensis]
MASFQDEFVRKQNIVLSEKDIPGAELPRETIEQCSVVQRRMVKDYIKSGPSARYLRDPDGCINVLWKKAELGVIENANPIESSSTFPEEGVDGRCNHVTATLFALDESVKKGLKLFQMHQICHAPPSHADGTFPREWPDHKVKNSKLNLLKDYEVKSNKKVGWIHILPQVVPQDDEGSKENEEIPDLLSSIEEHPVSLPTINERCQCIKKKLNLSKSEIKDIQGASQTTRHGIMKDE